MIRFKQSFGNDIKCKIDEECMISTYEINLLAARHVSGLFKIQADKSGGLSFQGNTDKNISQYMTKGINQQQLILIVSNIVRIHLETKKIGLGPTRLVWNPDWVFVNEESEEIFVIYLPVNGVSVNYDIVMFLKEIIYLAKLEGRDRDNWLEWLRGVDKSGITEDCLDRVKSFRRRRREDAWGAIEKAGERLNMGRRASDRRESDDFDDSKTEVDDEPMTGMDEEFGGEYPTNVDDGWSLEPPTGMDEEDEMPTGQESEYTTWGGMDKADGTIIESTSESGYFENDRPPVLIRLSTGERVAVSKAEFRIGRSPQRADYCIVGNSSISNVHAIIRKQGNDYFLSDNHSTNGTYVDGRKLEANGSQAKLRNGCIIKVWNEELEFRM